MTIEECYGIIFSIILIQKEENGRKLAGMAATAGSAGESWLS